MLRLLIWILAALSVPMLLNGAFYGPKDLGFEARSPKEVIGPVRSELAESHGWVQEKLATVENTLEDAHQFVTRVWNHIVQDSAKLRNEWLPYLRDRLKEPLQLAPRTDATPAE